VRGVENISTVDSTWIESMVGVGLVGTGVLAAFFLGAARRVWRRAGPLSIAIVVLYALQSWFNQVLALQGSTMLIIGIVLLAPLPERGTRRTLQVAAVISRQSPDGEASSRSGKERWM
jgi:hypothetical protein